MTKPILISLWRAVGGDALDVARDRDTVAPREAIAQSFRSRVA